MTIAGAIRHHPPLGLAVAGGIITMLVAFAPLVYLPDVEVEVIRFYFGGGIGGLWAVALLSFVTVVVFLAAIRGRIDLIRVASIGLGIGVVTFVIAAIWALTIDTGALAELPQYTWVVNHRWLVLASTVVVPVASLWLARRLDVI